jgi:hypothetical protein
MFALCLHLCLSIGTMKEKGQRDAFTPHSN